MFPGIVAGVITNILCSLFDPNAIYYSLISSLIALASAWMIRGYKTNKVKSIIKLIAILAVISGVLGTAIQYILLGGSHFETVRNISDRIGGRGIGSFVTALLVDIGINIFDKTICVLLATLIWSLIPASLCTDIRNSAYRQKPLTIDSKRDIAQKALQRGKGRNTLAARISITLIFVALLLTVIMGIISIKLYQNNVKSDYAENAHNSARLASTVIDAERIDEYIEKGEDAPGYKETEERLYNIRDNSQGVKYLYVFQIRDDGCYVAFDLETEDTAAYKHGDKIEFEAAFEPYLSALFAGEEIPPIESNDISGWVLTSYYPVKDKAGNTVCYVGADVSMVYLSEYVRNFIAKTILIFSGLFVLIIGYGLWLSGYYLLYPISSMTECAKDFANISDDQKSIDDKVNAMKRIDIRTNDEVEDLYQSVCKMSVDMAEQLRRLRHYAGTNAQMQNGLIVTMADMVESRDSDTGAHTQKTAEYVRIIVEGLKKKGYYTEKISDKFISDVIMSAPLHDVGKINISDTILNKPGRLNDEEFDIMKTHTTAGKNLIEKAISTVQGESYLREARYMAGCHHERFDGKGYPDGLHGEAIPLSARIMAVADVFDALTSKRVYKDAFTIEQSVEILKEGAGSQFDPKCVEVFLDNMDQVEEVLKEFKE